MHRLILAILFASSASPLFAQGDDRPRAYFTADLVKPDATTEPAPLAQLDLRPNSGSRFSVVLINPTDKAYTNLKVVLASTENGDGPIAEGIVAELPKRSSEPKAPRNWVKVPLEAKSAAAPADAKTADPKAAATPAGSPLPEKLWLIVTGSKDDAKPTLQGITPTDVRVVLLKKDLNIKASTKKSTDDKKAATGYTLTVEIDNKPKSEIKQFAGNPAKIGLRIFDSDFRELDPALLKKGTYRTELAPGKAAVLIAEDLPLAPNGTYYFSLDVDGVPNTVVFSFVPEGNAQSLTTGKTIVRAPRYAKPGDPLAVSLEIFGNVSVAEGKPKLEFDRSGRGIKEEMQEIERNTPRDTKTTFTIERGDFAARADVKDWSIPLDTAGLHGPRKIRFSIPLSGSYEAYENTTITFDDSAPVNARFDESSAKEALRGKKFKLAAFAEDPESQIVDDKVYFFLGDPPVEGKKPAKGLYAKAIKDKNGLWTAEFDVPEGKGPIDASVRFTNGVGLVRELTVEIPVKEPPKPKEKRTTATIKGSVTQFSGRIPQAKVKVVLLDKDGKAAAQTESDDKGNYVFDNVKPESYTVMAEKPADFSKGEAAVTVAADETKEGVNLELSRHGLKPSPLKKDKK